jgi:hypothetical protein
MYMAPMPRIPCYLQVLPVVITGLQDKDDDVKAVAAEALLPVVQQTVTLHFDVVSSRVWLSHWCMQVENVFYAP